MFSINLRLKYGPTGVMQAPAGTSAPVSKTLSLPRARKGIFAEQSI